MLNKNSPQEFCPYLEGAEIQDREVLEGIRIPWHLKRNVSIPIPKAFGQGTIIKYFYYLNKISNF
jgi:hypothetical protein